ncbi:MAG: glutamate racemase [Armatimonadota bacterium]
MTSPIGVFDSGLGGLSVAARILQILPNERIVYFADTAHVPYGERSFDEIQQFSLNIVRFLVGKGVKAVVAACNLSSAVALTKVRDTWPDLPILGVIEPGARAAVQASNGNPIGVLATTGAIKSQAYDKAIARLDDSIKVTGQACPKFVPLVESGLAESDQAKEAAREYVPRLLEAGCKTIVLGCTHYPFLMKSIRSAAGEDIAIIDPAQETAAELGNILTRHKIASDELKSAHEFYSSGDSSGFKALGSEFLGRDIDKVTRVDIEDLPRGTNI